MTVDQVKEVARGRVWTGTDAKEIGLVDEIGGMKKAIAIAQEMAELENYELENYPKKKDPVEQLIEEISGNLETRFIKYKLGESYKYYEKMETVSKQTGIMARIPYDIEIH